MRAARVGALDDLPPHVTLDERDVEGQDHRRGLALGAVVVVVILLGGVVGRCSSVAPYEGQHISAARRRLRGAVWPEAPGPRSRRVGDCVPLYPPPRTGDRRSPPTSRRRCWRRPWALGSGCSHRRLDGVRGVQCLPPMARNLVMVMDVSIMGGRRLNDAKTFLSLLHASRPLALGSESDAVGFRTFAEKSTEASSAAPRRDRGRAGFARIRGSWALRRVPGHRERRRRSEGGGGGAGDAEGLRLRLDKMMNFVSTPIDFDARDEHRGVQDIVWQG